MEQMIGKHGNNWLGVTKARKDINLYFGWMKFVNGLGASLWLAQTVWISFNYAVYSPHCVSSKLDKEMAVDACLGSWKIFITGLNDQDGRPDRVTKKYFAFIKLAPAFMALMGMMFFVAIRYWLQAEQGRVSNYTTEYKDKMLPTMDDEAAEKRRLHNVRADRIAYITRAIVEFPGDQWYFTRYLLANFMTGCIILGQLITLHYVLGDV